MFSSCDGENLYTICFSEGEMKLYSKFKGSRKLWERLEEPDEVFGVNQKEAGKYFKGKSKDETKQILSGEAKTGLKEKLINSEKMYWPREIFIIQELKLKETHILEA